MMDRIPFQALRVRDDPALAANRALRARFFVGDRDLFPVDAILSVTAFHQ
jgi:hypothetical protein